MEDGLGTGVRQMRRSEFRWTPGGLVQIPVDFPVPALGILTGNLAGHGMAGHGRATNKAQTKHITYNGLCACVRGRGN